MYIEEKCSDVDILLSAELLRGAGHWECLEAVANVFFRKTDKKKHLVWLNGEANTGKSSFIECLMEIFCCVGFNFQQNYCVIDEHKKMQKP